jgi:hypothetical protein
MADPLFQEADDAIDSSGRDDLLVAMVNILEEFVDRRTADTHPARFELSDDPVVRKRIVADVDFADQLHDWQHTITVDRRELHRRCLQQSANAEQPACDYLGYGLRPGADGAALPVNQRV